jgi:hypothetical protein
MSTEYATFFKSNTMSAFFAGQGEILKKNKKLTEFTSLQDLKPRLTCLEHVWIIGTKISF